MKTLYFRFASTAALLLTACMTFAQFVPTEVTRSQQKTIINGKIYYIHTVLKGQTLYSISKVYEVTQEEILRENPGVDPQQLKEGQALKIPESTSQVLTPYPANKEDFYEHRVRRGQTVFSIARRYDVSEDVIYFYNPWARSGIKTDQTLWIPRTKEPLTIEQVPDDAELYFYYTVKEKDTLYSISKLYGVDVADIINQNPVLRNGLQPGQTLMIPKPQTILADSLQMQDSQLAVAIPCNPIAEDVTYKVALLLPFYADYIISELLEPKDTLIKEGAYITFQKQIETVGRNFVEFYEGFLLAADSLRSTGLRIELYPFDTERNLEKLWDIQRELLMLEPDLIIGPVYTELMDMVSKLALYQDVNIVSPLSVNPALVTENARLFQIVPSKETESIELANYLQQYKTGNFVLIRATDSISMNDSWRFKTQMLSHLPFDTTGNSPRFKDYILNDTLLQQIDSIMTKDEENIVVVFSENEPEVGRLVTSLYMISQECPIRLFGQPKWQIMTTVELSYLHSLQLTLFTPFYADYSNRSAVNFLRKCRTIYGFEPFGVSPTGYNFCMLGYDIGLYFLSALKQYGKEFQNCIGQVDSDLLLSNYRFHKTEDGGFINQGINFIRYNSDFTIEKTYYQPEELAEQQE